MAKMRIAVAGLVHDHVWTMLGQFVKSGKAVLVGAADPNRPLLEKIRKEYGVDRTFRDYRELFSKVKADAVMVASTNAGGCPIVEAAAAKGLDAMVEKPMAATAEQARRMEKASRKHGTRLMINWPISWSPASSQAMDMVADGAIGRVFHAKIHMAHQGPKEAGCTPYFYGWLYDRKENGGGAIIDYCCYGAVVFATLWGSPKQVFGVARNLVKPRFPVDDNAIVTAIYDKTIAVAQASWTQNPDFHDALYLGEKGTLVTDRGKLLLSGTKPKDFSHYGSHHIRVREVPLRPLPAGRRNGPEHFLHCIATGRQFHKLCSARSGVIAQEILSAGVKSEKTGRRIAL
jgi:predicted dehydrogenase